ncbi:hypothetical protein GE061_003947 [Apolygus lucorum]|uniref:Uncharacterized protein n=1 Tax=Apolygus lucorum TaxID=248454 RepID=A0A8S9X0H9_APOLU|nr:hypothetical protein GE061_003947 [Apolygus lucorum]
MTTAGFEVDSSQRSISGRMGWTRSLAVCSTLRLRKLLLFSIKSSPLPLSWTPMLKKVRKVWKRVYNTWSFSFEGHQVLSRFHMKFIQTRILIGKTL